MQPDYHGPPHQQPLRGLTQPQGIGAGGRRHTAPATQVEPAPRPARPAGRVAARPVAKDTERRFIFDAASAVSTLHAAITYGDLVGTDDDTGTTGVKPVLIKAQFTKPAPGITKLCVVSSSAHQAGEWMDLLYFDRPSQHIQVDSKVIKISVDITAKQLLKLLETRLQRTMHEELRNGIWVIPMRVASLPSHPDVEGSRLVWRRMNLGPFKALNIRDIEDFSIEDHLRQADHYLVMPGMSDEEEEASDEEEEVSDSPLPTTTTVNITSPNPRPRSRARTGAQSAPVEEDVPVHAPPAEQQGRSPYIPLPNINLPEAVDLEDMQIRDAVEAAVRDARGNMELFLMMLETWLAAHLGEVLVEAERRSMTAKLLHHFENSQGVISVGAFL